MIIYNLLHHFYITYVSQRSFGSFFILIMFLLFVILKELRSIYIFGSWPEVLVEVEAGHHEVQELFVFILIEYKTLVAKIGLSVI